MSYVNAGYSIGLSALFLYSLSLVLRRRRLERRVELTDGGTDRTGGGEKASGP